MTPEETRAVNNAIFHKLAAIDYLHDKESVNSGFNDWFKEEYGRNPGSGEGLGDAQHDAELRQTYLSAFHSIMSLAGWSNLRVERLLSKPVPMNPTIAAINDFTRQRMFEDGRHRRIVPPVTIDNNRLDKEQP